MKKTLAAGLVLSALLPMTARADSYELGIFADKLIGQAATLNLPNPVPAGSDLTKSGSYNSSSPSGYGLRVAYNFIDLKVVSLGAAATFHPRVSTDLTLGGTSLGRFSEQYNAIGLQADWKFLLNLHAGIEYRSEKVTTAQNQGGSTIENPIPATYPAESTTLTRPWAKVGFGFQAPTPVVTPFVRLELAAPLSKPANTGDANTDDFRKAMAPSLQVALYGGIRF